MTGPQCLLKQKLTGCNKLFKNLVLLKPSSSCQLPLLPESQQVMATRGLGDSSRSGLS